jgi:hypothetical protein
MGKDSIPGVLIRIQPYCKFGKVMQLISELQYMKPIAKLESATADDAMGLDAGAKIITWWMIKGATIEMKLGQPTATTSGTYVKVADSYYIVNTPVVEGSPRFWTVEGLAKPTETPTLVSGNPNPVILGFQVLKTRLKRVF